MVNWGFKRQTTITIKPMKPMTTMVTFFANINHTLSLNHDSEMQQNVLGTQLGMATAMQFKLKLVQQMTTLVICFEYNLKTFL